MIDKHLQYSIETAMKQMLADANSVLVGGMAEAVKVKLNELRDSLTFTVKAKR
jgi:hypothetical protein